MNFNFTEEHLMIQESAKDFALNEIAPSAVQRDKSAEFPSEIVKKMGELGFMGMMVSPDYGGAGMDTVSYVLAMMEISKVDASVAILVSVHNSLACWIIETFGTDFQKEKWPQEREGLCSLKMF